MSEWDPARLYRAARHAETRMSGSYHENVRVDTPDGPVLVRIPFRRPDQMDLRIWDESDVLRAVARHTERVPRLLHVCTDPPFQIHELIPGTQLNKLAPRGTPVPPTVIPDVLTLFSRLAAIPLDEVPPLPDGWPTDGECAAFACVLSAATQRIHDEYRDDFGELFDRLGIPDDPLASIEAVWPALARRPFRVLHADVHRKNIVISDRGAVFLDWELALYGDPVYDLAVHVNKMTYLDDELSTLLAGWRAGAGPAAARGWRADLIRYLQHERVKSAIVHSVRYAKKIADAATGNADRQWLVRKLTGILNAAGPIWGWDRPARVPEVATVLRDAAPFS